MKKTGAKHKLCRRLGGCVWGNPKCPSVKRPYPSGASAKRRRSKLSPYAELLLEKQRLRAHYALTERQLRFAYSKAKRGISDTGEKLLSGLEMRLATVVWRSGLAPSIFAAKQAVTHRHILVDGRTVDRPGYGLRPGQVLTVDAQRSPAIANTAQKSDAVPPPYMEVDKDGLKVTVTRPPLLDEIPAGVQIMRVIEYYAR